MADSIYIGLAGNPNCGKTTLFNELTGSNGYVGNWPGVTVEKKMAEWREDKDVTFVDLPGIYSLSPYSPEEVVSRDYLLGDRPDAVIDLIDVTNLERNLYLTTQVLETGRPVVVGLNMCDLLKERGDVVDAKKLSEMLGVPVVEVSALHDKNLDELVKQAIAAAKAGKATAGTKCFSPETEEALARSRRRSSTRHSLKSSAGTRSRSSSAMPRLSSRLASPRPSSMPARRSSLHSRRSATTTPSPSSRPTAMTGSLM